MQISGPYVPPSARAPSWADSLPNQVNLPSWTQNGGGPQLRGPSGLGGIGSLPNITKQPGLQRQQNPLDFFVELLKRLQTIQPPGQPGGGGMGGGQMPDIGKILQMIGPIMQQIGPMIRGFQQPTVVGQPAQPAAVPQDTTSVYD